MNAPERVLTAINHEEPDIVPAFESTFTSNTIMKHYGVNPRPIPRGVNVSEKILKQIILQEGRWNLMI